MDDRNEPCFVCRRCTHASLNVVARIQAVLLEVTLHTKTGFITIIAVFDLTAVFFGIATADEKPAAARSPSAWGMLGTHKACVIFREYRKTKVGFYVVVVTAKTHGELEVIEASDGYDMDRKIYMEDEATMDQLQHRAIQDGLRYVKIQDKYTPEEMEAARALCKQDVVTG